MEDDSFDNPIKEKMVSILYCLIKDYLPYGVLAQMLRQNVNPITQDTPYSNKILLKLAGDLYDRFIAA